jgi:hypothetical protein
MANVKIPEVGLILTLLLYGPEMMYGNSSWENTVIS